MEAGDEFHGSEIEFAPVVRVEDGAEVFGVIRVELFLGQAGEKGADDVVDLGGHPCAVFEGNGCCRRLRVRESADNQGG